MNVIAIHLILNQNILTLRTFHLFDVLPCFSDHPSLRSLSIYRHFGHVCRRTLWIKNRGNHWDTSFNNRHRIPFYCLFRGNGFCITGCIGGTYRTWHQCDFSSSIRITHPSFDDLGVSCIFCGMVYSFPCSYGL